MKKTETPPVSYILTDAGRFVDLMKQGFMKPLPVRRLRKDGKPVGAPRQIVACHGCKDWHRDGQHTVTDADQRRANLAEYRAAERRATMLRYGAVAE